VNLENKEVCDILFVNGKDKGMSIRYTHTIFYVADISQALLFYNNAFGFAPKFVHESNQYAELSTGAVVLAFASEQLGVINLPTGYLRNDTNTLPQGCEIVFTVSDVTTLYQKALDAGAISVAPPTPKPWGQLVAYVRDPNGILIELASPMV
jgi:lactoylglutathione lyase